MRRRILHILFVLLACTACRSAGGPSGALQEGDMFVDFPLSGGKAFSEYAGRGTYVLVYGWASWSAPSVTQLSRLEAESAELAAGKVNALALALCDTPADAASLAARRAPSVPLAVSEDVAPVHLLGVDTLPVLMLFGPDGTLLKRDLRWRDLPKILRYTGGN
ncbi:MAG: TlpA family protein disulfide reductase [Bacteroidales bacterium]|nr:TlpA family protein disulfide reductase [Bacteroidales bacterium]